MGTASVLPKRQESRGCQGLRLLEEKAVRSLEEGRAAQGEIRLRPPGVSASVVLVALHPRRALGHFSDIRVLLPVGVKR